MSDRVFLWKPYEDLDLPKEVLLELEDLSNWDAWGGLTRYESFSWDDEDNEGHPEIAKYVSNKYNEYFFFIDMHTGRERLE